MIAVERYASDEDLFIRVGTPREDAALFTLRVADAEVLVDVATNRVVGVLLPGRGNAEVRVIEE